MANRSKLAERKSETKVSAFKAFPIKLSKDTSALQHWIIL